MNGPESFAATDVAPFNCHFIPNVAFNPFGKVRYEAQSSTSEAPTSMVKTTDQLPVGAVQGLGGKGGAYGGNIVGNMTMTLCSDMCHKAGPNCMGFMLAPCGTCKQKQFSILYRL